jgi:hypothetical protein
MNSGMQLPKAAQSPLNAWHPYQKNAYVAAIAQIAQEFQTLKL